MSTLRPAPYRLIIPSGHYVEHALALQRSAELRNRLRSAPVVVAVHLDGTQEVLWGVEDLIEGHARGELTAEVAMFRVTDEEDSSLLIGMLLSEKGFTGQQSKSASEQSGCAVEA